MRHEEQQSASDSTPNTRRNRVPTGTALPEKPCGPVDEGPKVPVGHGPVGPADEGTTGV